MANSLHKDLKKGDEIVLKANILKEEFRSLENRIFIVRGGFGMQAGTMGTALYGNFKIDDEDCRWEGYDIDAAETVAYWASLGVTHE